jgi:hypothetical protein
MSMTIWDRYTHDPLFARIVDLLVGMLGDATFTPTEMREAAMLAQLKYEDMHPRPTVFTKDEVIRGRV